MQRTFSFGQLEDLVKDALTLIEDGSPVEEALLKTIDGNEVTDLHDVAYIGRGVAGHLESEKRPLHMRPAPLTGRIL